MALSSDLLELAGTLAHLDPNRPKQAVLRRAVSTAYYAVFHFLIEQTTRRVAGVGPGEAGLRAYLARRPSHGGMKNVCKDVSLGKWPSDGKKWSGIGAVLQTPAQTLMNVSASFVTLQELRHAADYDTSARFTRSQVIIEVERAEALFGDWQGLPNGPQQNFFLFLLATDATAS